MRIIEFLTHLTAKGICCFSSAQAREALSVSDVAARSVLRRLKQKGELAQPLQGFYVIVPPEYRILGCRPAEHFINELMEYIGTSSYYVGLLSAAQYYGAAHHRPQQFQVVTEQKRRPINCGRVKIVFITKKHIQDVPIQKFSTSQSVVTLSTPEATAMDLIIYANRCGGMDNVLTVLSDLIKRIDPIKLKKLATASKEVSWVQRLGYLLDLLNAQDLSDELTKKIKRQATHVRTLVAHHRLINKFEKLNKKVDFIQVKYKKSVTKLPRNKKWKLIVNKKLEPDI